MRNLAPTNQETGRLRFDSTGLVPHSEVWFAYWTDLLDRNLNGEPIECARFPIEVIDRLIEMADREEQARNNGVPDGDDYAR
jgi:hypothetical protein